MMRDFQMGPAPDAQEEAAGFPRLAKCPLFDQCVEQATGQQDGGLQEAAPHAGQVLLLVKFVGFTSKVIEGSSRQVRMVGRPTPIAKSARCRAARPAAAKGAEGP